MAEKKIVGWFTVNGKHIPVLEGESKSDAFKRKFKDSGDTNSSPKKKSVAELNEEIKEKQITKNKEQAENAKAGTISENKSKKIIDDTEVDETYRAYMDARGLKELPKDADKLLEESKSAKLDRLLKIAEAVEASATVGYDSSKDNYIGIHAGKHKFDAKTLKEIESNPTSMDSIRKGIADVIETKQSYKAEAPATAKLLKQSILSDHAEDDFWKKKNNIKSMSNVKIIGVTRDVHGNFDVTYEYDAVTPDGKKYHSTNTRYGIDLKYLKNKGAK